MRKRRFQQRFIAFVDILGFRDVVQRMAAEGHLFTTVRDTLKKLDSQSELIKGYRLRSRKRRDATIRKGKIALFKNSDLQMTAFSDCYVLSESSPAWHVLLAVQKLGADLLTAGILTRGAVVQGEAYHKGRVLFGPGIVDAYKLESEVAKYPRILVSEGVRQAVWGYHEGLWKNRLLERDVDGCWFVNLLTPSLSSWALLSNPDAPQDVSSHLQRVRASLTDGWRRAQGNPGYMSKVWWLIHRFNRVAEKEGLDKIKA